MKDRLKKWTASLGPSLAWVGGIVALRGAVTVFLYKWVALQFGAAGVALFSHFQNFVSLFTQVPDQGTTLGVMAVYPGHTSKGKLMAHAMLTNVVVFGIVGAIVFVGKDVFLSRFGGVEETGIPLWLIGSAIFVFLFNSVVYALFYAARAFKRLFFLTLSNVLLLAGFIWYFSGAVGEVMVAFVIGWGVNTLINLSVGLWAGTVPKPTWIFDMALVRELASFMLIAAVGLLFGKMVDYFVRDFSFQWFGEEATGLWQAQVRLSDSYRSAFMGTAGLLFYSHITHNLNEDGRIIAWSRRTSLLIMMLLIPVLFSIWLFREPIFALLYAQEMVSASSFLHWQLIADVFAMPSFLLVYLMVAKRNFIAYISLHIGSAVAYLLLIALLSGVWDNVEALPAANALRYGAFLIALLLFFRR